MKKILSALALMLFVSTVTIAQSNLTLIMKNKVDFNRTEFKYTVSGLNNAKQVSAFYTKIQENAEVASVKDAGKDADGNHSFILTMKNAQNRAYYLNWASKLGISYILNEKGEKHTPQELLATKEENHNREAAHKH